MNNEMMNKWALIGPERDTVTDFWEWVLANAEDSSWCVPNADISKISLLDIHIERALDQYQGIDQKQLDDERRALLESIKL